MFNQETIREDFPILKRQVHGRPLVYLDNAATSQKPRQVIQALVDYYELHNANIHRGVHTLAEEATDLYEGARRRIGRFIGAESPASIIFTRNTTESINLVARTWGTANLRAGDEIVISEMEHHSNLVPWQMLAAERGVVLRYLEIDGDGQLSLEQAARLIGPRTRLVAISHTSNVLGTINPVAELGRLAHAQGALVLVDGAQGVPHMRVNVAELGADFLAFSSHKMLGPTGVGVLYGRPALLEAMPPFLGGGDMIEQVERERFTTNALPYKFEAGTPNIGDVIAFGAAIDYLEALGMDAVREHERELVAYALETIGAQPDVTVYGPKDPAHRAGVVAFNVGDIHPHDLGQIVDYDGVAIRAGHHCCQVLMRKLDIPGTGRASFYIYNTREDIDSLVTSLDRARKLLGSVA
ncbi:MAG: cysteine desulfurase [Chloroflexi bacterium]|nr:cysteine desulfurase [Chloroflexota bacterium]